MLSTLENLAARSALSSLSQDPISLNLALQQKYLALAHCSSSMHRSPTGLLVAMGNIYSSDLREFWKTPKWPPMGETEHGPYTLEMLKGP